MTTSLNMYTAREEGWGKGANAENMKIVENSLWV